jgi:hypothetical protein
MTTQTFRGVSNYTLGKFQFWNYSLDKDTNEPFPGTEKIRGIATVNSDVVAGSVGFIKEKVLLAGDYDFTNKYKDAKDFIFGLDGVFVRVFKLKDDTNTYVLPYRPTTIMNTNVNGSKQFMEYLTKAGINLDVVKPGWCYYFQITDPVLSLGSNISTSSPTIVYYGRQNMMKMDEYMYKFNTYEYKITDMELPEHSVKTVDFKDIMNIVQQSNDTETKSDVKTEGKSATIPSIIYPIKITNEQAVEVIKNDEAVVFTSGKYLVKVCNTVYETRKNFRTPGDYIRSCATILQAIVKDNTMYCVNGKTYPSSAETKVADAIAMCKYIHPRVFHHTINSLHIVFEHMRDGIASKIMDDYLNNHWRTNIRVQQICQQAFGYAKRMNNQHQPSIQQIQQNIKHLVMNEKYDSLVKLNNHYKVQTI